MTQLVCNQKADNRLLAILKELYVGILLIDPNNHTIVYANPEAARIIGRPLNEMIGKICHDYVCPAAIGECPITDLNQTVDQSERCVLDSRKQKIPIMKTVKRIEFNSRPHLLESFLDISDVKEKERLQGALEMAGAASHHLSQPLQVLTLGMKYLLPPNTDEKTKIISDEVLLAIEQLRDIVTNIQNITKYETEEYVDGKLIVDIKKSSLRD